MKEKPEIVQNKKIRNKPMKENPNIQKTFTNISFKNPTGTCLLSTVGQGLFLEIL